MTDQPHSDDHPAEEQQTDIDPATAERLLAPGSTVRRRNKLLDLARDTVLGDTRNYAVGRVLDEDIRATFDAEGVTATGGRPKVIVDLLHGFERLLEAMGANVFLTRLEFGNSVTMEMRPVIPEEVATRVRERVETNPDGIVTHEDLRDLIPFSVVAANTTARLLDTPGEIAFAEARRYGVEVAEAYETFAKTVEAHAASVEFTAPGQRRAHYDMERAKLALVVLKEPEQLDPIVISIVGKLTRADSDEAVFRVVLDRDHFPPEFDARRRVVEGQYTTGARTQVQENGLWDQRVVARVRAWPVRQPGHRKPTFERFQFQDIRRAAG